MARPRVLLTGATGAWGRATLRELRERDNADVVALVRPTRADRAIMAEFSDMERLRVVWGDLTSPDDVRRAVAGVDIVLHLGAVVSPLADARPALAQRVNVGGMRHLVDAVRAAPQPIALVGVGSVAETGDRPSPVHWGRVGDPLRPSRFDRYAQTKITAEAMLVDSGLPKWLWLRQTGIFHPNLLAVRDPIMTHSPLSGVLEWVSDTDSARLLAGIVEGAPDELWCTVRNIGGGAGWRMTNWAFQQALGAAMGVADMRAWYERRWFALQNFHGHWFADSDELEALVPFRRDRFDEALRRAVDAAPASVRQAGRVPAGLVKQLVIRPTVHRPRGTMWAVRARRHDQIAAHYGSLQAWRAIGGWDEFVDEPPSATPTLLDHGYDEGLAPSRWRASDLAAAAAFRGGELVDDHDGDWRQPRAWRCHEGHRFEASPRLVLHAGHWCPMCVTQPAEFAEQARHNRFLAQVEAGQ